MQTTCAFTRFVRMQKKPATRRQALVPLRMALSTGSERAGWPKGSGAALLNQRFDVLAQPILLLLVIPGVIAPNLTLAVG